MYNCSFRLYSINSVGLDMMFCNIRLFCKIKPYNNAIVQRLKSCDLENFIAYVGYALRLLARKRQQAMQLLGVTLPDNKYVKVFTKPYFLLILLLTLC